MRAVWQMRGSVYFIRIMLFRVIAYFSVLIIHAFSSLSPGVAGVERVSGAHCSFRNERAISVDILNIKTTDCFHCFEQF